LEEKKRKKERKKGKKGGGGSKTIQVFWAVALRHLASRSKCFKDTTVLCNTMTTHPVTECHIPENLNPQQHSCTSNLKLEFLSVTQNQTTGQLRARAGHTAPALVMLLCKPHKTQSISAAFLP